MVERTLELPDEEPRIEDIPCGWCNGSGNDESGIVIVGPTKCRVCEGSQVRGSYRTIQHKLEQDRTPQDES